MWHSECVFRKRILSIELHNAPNWRDTFGSPPLIAERNRPGTGQDREDDVIGERRPGLAKTCEARVNRCQLCRSVLASRCSGADTASPRLRESFPQNVLMEFEPPVQFPPTAPPRLGEQAFWPRSTGGQPSSDESFHFGAARVGHIARGVSERGVQDSAQRVVERESAMVVR